ncbi:MAG TPA: DUF4328 domain-containing protein [Pirellulaceae bacterium]|nr:DUF4328 domain-containing protein [Pirellulaceae bacterium]
MATNLNPSQSLQRDEDQNEEHEAGQPPFRSPQFLGALTCIGLGLNIAAAVAALSLQFAFEGTEGAPQGDYAETVDGPGKLAIWMAFADMALQLLRILTGVLFVAWTYRVHCNLLALGHKELDFKPIAGVVVWFIPLVGLVLPCLVMREIAWRSDPQAENLGRDNRSLVLVNWWWRTFLVSPVTFLIQLLIPESLEALSSDVAFRWNIMLYLTVIVSGVLACWLILRINAQQAERLRLLQDQRIHPLSRPSAID